MRRPPRDRSALERQALAAIEALARASDLSDSAKLRALERIASLVTGCSAVIETRHPRKQPKGELGYM